MAMAVKDMIERKITKVGNSAGITLPSEVLNHLNAKQGDEIKLVLQKDGSVSIKKSHQLNFDGLEGIDQDFLDGVVDLFDRYDNTLRNLADR